MVENKELSKKEIEDVINQKLKEYGKLNTAEQYALFMGKTQLLEESLKSLLRQKFNVTDETIERLTLGQLKNELKNRKLRQDFIRLLEIFTKERNYIAHNFLSNKAIMHQVEDMYPVKFTIKATTGKLHKAIITLENIILFYDWCEKNNEW